MATVMVVDDEKNYLWMLEELLRGEGYEVITFDKGTEALKALADNPVDVLLTDLRMAEMDGLTVLERTQEISPATSMLLMTAYGTIERAVEAMRSGAYDFIVKPFANEQLLHSVAKAVERSALVRENVRLSRTIAGEYRVDNLIGNSPPMQALREKIKRVLPSKSTVLVIGESGSGKELVARAIHFNGPRCGKPFCGVNSGALTTSIAESELFGHEKGAFTGAHSRHIGLFEQATGGTLFLDEIAELPLDLQAKLLRVLDSQEIRRVGSEKTIRVDVRVLAATHRDLKAEVKKGKFREDLFFRLSVVRLDVPPLRERKGDIPLLAEFFLQDLLKEESSIRGKRFAPAAMELLTSYKWPGNVRELQNAVAHAAVMALDADIQPSDFELEEAASGEWLNVLDQILPANAPLDATLRSIERHMISRALARSNSVQAKAAQLLKISRSLFQYKLKQFHKPPDQL
jgi:two-component system NtrC family response regulator